MFRYLTENAKTNVEYGHILPCVSRRTCGIKRDGSLIFVASRLYYGLGPSLYSSSHPELALEETMSPGPFCGVDGTDWFHPMKRGTGSKVLFVHSHRFEGFGVHVGRVGGLLVLSPSRPACVQPR